MGFRGISGLGSAFFFLRCFKLAHICIQVTSLHRCNKQGINHTFLFLAYFTWGVKLRESWTKQLQPFGCVLREVFRSGVSDIYSRGKRVATWSSRCALKSLCRYAYYIGAVCLFFWAQIRKHRCDPYKKRRPCVVSNISIVAISVGLPVAVNNPVPASQVGFQQFRAI